MSCDLSQPSRTVADLRRKADSILPSQIALGAKLPPLGRARIVTVAVFALDLARLVLDDVLRLARLSARPLRATEAELGLSPESLRRWVIQADIDAGRVRA
jgi:hypothetical protein